MALLDQITRRPRAEWLSLDPVLPREHLGIESDFGKGKEGNGVLRWSQLAYVDVSMLTHENDPTAHDASQIASGDPAAPTLAAWMAAQSSRYATVVSHGATAATTRPTAAQVIWLGTVEPTNGTDGDLWVSGTGLSFRASGVWSTTTSDAFVPSSVAGLIAWFRADLLTGLANADPISTWPDLSGNSNNLISASTNRPTYRTGVINGRAVARFDGVNDYMARTYSAALTQPTTIFMVYKAATVEQTVLIDGLGSSRHSIQSESGTNNLRIYAGTSVASTTALTTNPSVLSATFSGAASDLRLNGTTIATGNSGSQTMSGITLGAEPSYTYCFDGDIAEVLIYNSALSLADRQYVERALGEYYGVTVA